MLRNSLSIGSHFSRVSVAGIVPLACAFVLAAAGPGRANAVTHDTVPLWSAWGGAHGHPPGTAMFIEDSITLLVHPHDAAGVWTYNEAVIQPELVDTSGGWQFGTAQILNCNNVNVEYDFTALPIAAPDTVEFEYAWTGGTVNWSANAGPLVVGILDGFLPLSGSSTGGATLTSTYLADIDMNADGTPDGHRARVRIVSPGPIDNVFVGGQELWIDNLSTSRGGSSPGPGPCQILVNFESQALGTIWGSSVPHPIGHHMFSEDSVDVYTNDFIPAAAPPTYGDLTIDPVFGAPVNFGFGSNVLRFNNCGADFDIALAAALHGITVTEVEFHWLDLAGIAGDENLQVNGAVLFTGEIDAFPAAIAPGVTYSTTSLPVPGGKKGVATLVGKVDKLRLGGSEFWVDEICVRGTLISPAGCPNLVDYESQPNPFVFSNATGYPIGSYMFTEAGVRLSTDSYFPPVGPPLYNECRIVPPFGPFGAGLNILRHDNMNVRYDLSAFSTVTEVTWDWIDLGGPENLEVNGAGMNINDIHLMPVGIAGGVSFTTTAVPVAGGRMGSARLLGNVAEIRMGGQEYWVDNLCVYGTLAASGAPVVMRLGAGLEMAPPSPNPFNVDTELAFSLQNGGAVSATVYDIVGRKVATLVDRVMPAGRHTMRWDGRSDAGRPVAAGTYFVRLESGGEAKTTKLMYLR